MRGRNIAADDHVRVVQLKTRLPISRKVEPRFVVYKRRLHHNFEELGYMWNYLVHEPGKRIDPMTSGRTLQMVGQTKYFGSWSSKNALLATLLLACLSCLLVEVQSAPEDKKKSGGKSIGVPSAGTTGDFSKPYGSHLQAILEAVNATREQRTSITAIVEQFRPKIDPLRQSYQQKKAEFLNALTTGTPAEQILSRQNDLSQLYSDISCQYCQMSLEVRKQLNPDQVVLYENYKLKQGWTHKKSQ